MRVPLVLKKFAFKARLDLPRLKPKGERDEPGRRNPIDRRRPLVSERSALEYREMAGSAVGVRMLRTRRGCLAAIILFATVLFAALLSGAVAAPAAAANRSPAAIEGATPKQIQELMTLLADPKVRDWLEQESKAEAAQARASDAEARSISHEFDSRVSAIRDHLVALGAALPNLPDQI